jgi:hypothetical protein
MMLCLCVRGLGGGSAWLLFGITVIALALDTLLLSSLLSIRLQHLYSRKKGISVWELARRLSKFLGC